MAFLSIRVIFSSGRLVSIHLKRFIIRQAAYTGTKTKLEISSIVWFTARRVYFFFSSRPLLYILGVRTKRRVEKLFPNVQSCTRGTCSGTNNALMTASSLSLWREVRILMPRMVIPFDGVSLCLFSLIKRVINLRKTVMWVIIRFGIGIDYRRWRKGGQRRYI